MKVVVLGAGALGSILAGHLARAGEEVIVIARGARARSIEDDGLRLTGLQDFTARAPVFKNARKLGHADVLLVTVKTYDTETALDCVRGLQVGAVLSIQNGVLKNEQLAGVFGWERTLGAIADCSGEVLADGRVFFSRNEGLVLGELPAGRSERASNLARTLARAGIRAEESPDIHALEWWKYVTWMSLMPLAVLTRLATHRMLQDPDLAALNIMLLREGVRLAERLGIDADRLGDVGELSRMPIDQASARISEKGALMERQGVTAHKMSTLQDLERGRRLEIEETFGYALEKARERDLSLPVMATCHRLVSSLDRVFRQGPPDEKGRRLRGDVIDR